MWKKVSGPLPNKWCLAFDAIGKTVGVWNGYSFDSIGGAYSFDNMGSRGPIFYVINATAVCGHITHWMPLPCPPAVKKCAN